jgi:hypothetical protein
MKKSLLLLIPALAYFISSGQTQPENVEIGLFSTETSGNTIKSVRHFEIALKAIKQTYTSKEVADDFIIYLEAPKSKFSNTDIIKIVQTSKSIYGVSGTMLAQSPVDPGGANLIFPIVLHSSEGMNLRSLKTHEWTSAFTFSFLHKKTAEACQSLRIKDQIEISGPDGITVLFQNLNITGVNQLKGIKENGKPAIIITDIPKKNLVKSEVKGIYPNPVFNTIYITINTLTRVMVVLQIMDATGHNVKQKRLSIEPGLNVIPFDVSSLAKGVYWVKMTEKQICSATVHKIIKQ